MNNTISYQYTADVISYSDYYPFGMLMPNRHGDDADGYRYGFNGMEKDDEVRGTKGASYDFGARMLDNRIGRWLSTDPLTAKFTGYSPYNFAVNNPVNAIDPDGKDVILIIWATNGQVGHAAIAVSNYKKVTKTVTETVMVLNDIGRASSEGLYRFETRTKIVTEMVPDGTYTYYDNWPNQEVSLGGVKGALTTVEAYRSKDVGQEGVIISNISEFSSGNLTTQHPYDPATNTGIPKEAHMQDGVLEITTDFETDEKVKATLEGLNKTETNYNGMTFNCATYTSCGLEEVLGKKVGKEYVKGPLYSTTPNQLWHDTKKAASDKGMSTKVLVDPGNKASQPYEQGLDNSASPSTPSTSPTTKKQ